MHPMLLALAPLLAPDLVVPGGAQPGHGAALALEGDLLAAGAPDAHRPEPAAGAVVLWRRAPGGWRRAGVVEGDRRALARFGAALDLEGGRLAVGSYFADGPEPRTGAVHLFEEGTATRLVPADAEEFDAFGWSVALEDDRLLVGAPFASRAGFQSGDARVFRRVNGAWVEQAALRPTGLAAFDHHGFAVAWAGELALIGAPDADLAGMGRGAVFVFEPGPTGWSEVAPLLSPALPAGAGLGSALAADGARVAVGAPAVDRVLVWRRRAGGWEVEAELEGAPASRFGAAVALSGPWLLVGAPDAGGGGEVRRYRRRAGTWSEGSTLTAEGVAGLGHALAIDAEPGQARGALGAPGAAGRAPADSAGKVLVAEDLSRADAWSP